MNSYRPNSSIAGQMSAVRHSSEKEFCELAQFQGMALFEPLAPIPTRNQIIGLAKALTSTRWQRKEFLSADLFGEPGWDMLLALYYAEGKGQRLTVSDLCVASESPQTTALRFLERLRQLDLVERVKSRTDGRIIYINLTSSAHTAIEGYLCQIWRTLFDQG